MAMLCSDECHRLISGPRATYAVVGSPIVAMVKSALTFLLAQLRPCPGKFANYVILTLLLVEKKHDMKIETA